MLFLNHLNKSACFDSSTCVIYLDISYLPIRADCISSFFHELGHDHCYRKNIWNEYHHPSDSSCVIKTGLKAKRWIDRWSTHEMEKKWYPRMKYHRSYYTKYGVDWYRKNYLSWFRRNRIHRN